MFPCDGCKILIVVGFVDHNSLIKAIARLAQRDVICLVQEPAPIQAPDPVVLRQVFALKPVDIPCDADLIESAKPRRIDGCNGFAPVPSHRRLRPDQFDFGLLRPRCDHRFAESRPQTIP